MLYLKVKFYNSDTSLFSTWLKKNYFCTFYSTQSFNLGHIYTCHQRLQAGGPWAKWPLKPHMYAVWPIESFFFLIFEPTLKHWYILHTDLDFYLSWKKNPALLVLHAYKVTCVINFPQSSPFRCTLYTNELTPGIEFSWPFYTFGIGGPG